MASKAVLDERLLRVLGPSGVYGRAAANQALIEADVVIAVGAFPAPYCTAWTPSIPPDRVIAVDIDGGAGDHADTVIEAEPELFLRAVREAAAKLDGHGDARARLLRAAHRDDPIIATQSGMVHPAHVCDHISAHLNAGTIVVTDVGLNANWAVRHIWTWGGNTFHTNTAHRTLGHAVAGGLGAWLARTDQGAVDERVIVTAGDGGFMRSATEISSAVAEAAAVTWVVFHNGTLGSPRAWFAERDREPVGVDLPAADFVTLARSLGADGCLVRTVEQLDEALAWAHARRTPTVIDVIVDPSAVPTSYELQAT
jgi:acetolactate synthase-1/2/3 large subunit